MIKILLFIAILCAAIFAGPFLADQQGFVHIATQDYIIETSLTTAVIIAIVSFIVLFLLCTLILKCLRIPKGTQSFFRRQHQRKSSSLQQEAVMAYEEGDYARVLTLIRKAGRNHSLEACFIGARAAFALQDYDLCRKFLDEAKSHNKQAFISSSIIRAKLNLEIGNAKAALEVLDELRDRYSSKLVTRLTYECYRKEQEHDKIAAMMPQLIRQNIVSKEEGARYTRENLMKGIDNAENASALNELISRLDKKDKQDPRLIAKLTSKLLELGDVNRARKFSLDLLKKNLDPDFLESIANWEISIPDVLSRLKKQAEDNLIASQVNTPLLKALGNLEFKAGQLKDAQEHLEKALQLNKSPDTYLKLAKVMAAQRLFEPASEYYAQALTAARKQLPHRA